MRKQKAAQPATETFTTAERGDNEDGCMDAAYRRVHQYVIDQARSKRSAFITLFQAATKSLTNFFFASDWP